MLELCRYYCIKFHQKGDSLKIILHKNSYPCDLVIKCITEFLNKLLAPKKNMAVAQPYLGKLSLLILKRINCIIKSKLPNGNLRFVYQTTCKISNFFTFKHMSSFLRPIIAHEFRFGGCTTYYRKTKRYFKFRASEHPKTIQMSEFGNFRTHWKKS